MLQILNLDIISNINYHKERALYGLIERAINLKVGLKWLSWGYDRQNLFQILSHKKKHLNIHNQASRKFPTLLIFKLSSCDSSPSMITTDGGSSKDDKMSSTRPNLILSDVLSSMSERK